MSKLAIRNALLAACLLLTPALAGAGCPKAFGNGTPTGAWYANQASTVTVMTLGRNGELMLSIEIYDSSPLVDGMKLELTATCKHPEQAKTYEDKSFELECSDTHIERASEGLGALFNLLVAVEDIASLVGGSDNGDGTWALRIKPEGRKLRLYNTDDETGEVTETLMEPISQKRANDYMERFREDTVKINRPVKREQRERDLP
jgi:hypothetical protein